MPEKQQEMLFITIMTFIVEALCAHFCERIDSQKLLSNFKQLTLTFQSETQNREANEKRKMYLLRTCPQYVMSPADTEHLQLHNKSIRAITYKNIARVCWVANNMHSLS